MLFYSLSSITSFRNWKFKSQPKVSIEGNIALAVINGITYLVNIWITLITANNLKIMYQWIKSTETLFFNKVQWII